MSAAPQGIARFGTSLNSRHLRLAEERWITRAIAEEAGLRSVDTFDGQDIVGRKGGDLSGIAFPYRDPETGDIRQYRLRIDNPEFEFDPEARALKPRNRYLWPAESRSLAYFPPGTDMTQLKNVGLPIIVTEGEFKTLALHRLSSHETAAWRFLAIGVAGVWSWRGTIGIQPGPDGTRCPVKGVIPDFDRIDWKGRKVMLAFDADNSRKPQVAQAESGLQKELRRRGANVATIRWDESAGKGVDDFLAQNGPGAFWDLIAGAKILEGGWRSQLICSERGTPKPLLANCVTALRHASEWKSVLAFDEFSMNVVVRQETPWNAPAGTVWDDHQDRLAAVWFQNQRIHVGVEVACQAVQTAAQDNAFHPLREYLNSLKWDGVDRTGTWLRDYLGVVESTYSRAAGQRWLIAAVARAFKPGVKADCVLILEGPQGAGKSTALRILGGQWFTDEIADLGSKDAALQTRGVWIIEIPELDAMSRSGVALIKAFMSRTIDRFRPPYSRHVIESPRQCVLAGSVNHSEYLRDETGGRRFWPVRCGQIDLRALERDRDQIWAETVALFRAGESWWFDTKELVDAAAGEQATRYKCDPWHEAIADWLNGKTDVCIDEILTRCLRKDISACSQADKNRVSECLQSLKWERFNSTINGRRQWKYRPVLR